MSKLIHAYCPKCKTKSHTYIRKSAKKQRTIMCMNLDCCIKFTVSIDDFKGES